MNDKKFSHLKVTFDQIGLKSASAWKIGPTLGKNDQAQNRKYEVLATWWKNKLFLLRKNIFGFSWPLQNVKDKRRCRGLNSILSSENRSVNSVLRTTLSLKKSSKLIRLEKHNNVIRTFLDVIATWWFIKTICPPPKWQIIRKSRSFLIFIAIEMPQIRKKLIFYLKKTVLLFFPPTFYVELVTPHFEKPSLIFPIINDFTTHTPKASTKNRWLKPTFFESPATNLKNKTHMKNKQKCKI